MMNQMQMMNQMHMMNQMVNKMGMGMMNNDMMMKNLNEEKVNEKNELNSEKKENSIEGIIVTFRISYPQSNPPPVNIYCLRNEKVSDIIHKYRKKSNDYESKKFVFNAKNLNQSLTVAEAGLINDSNIFVVRNGVKGAGGPAMQFTDVSKNKTREIKFSKNAPSYRKASKGINIFGICNCKNCKAYKQKVVVIIKKKKFDLIKERDDLFCPECGANIIPKTVGFYLCKYKIYGKKIEEDKIVPFDNDIDEANNKDSLKYFDPELNGEIIMIELIFEVIEYL